jgi:adenylate cyclase
MTLTVPEWELLDTLRSQIDSALEAALVNQTSVAHACQDVLHVAKQLLGMRGGFVQTYSEGGSLQTFSMNAPSEALEWAAHHDGSQGAVPARHDVHATDARCALRAIDVLGRWFGWVCFVTDDHELSALQERALDATCELLDNFLYGIYAAREKHQVMMQVGKALRHRVLGQGIQAAVSILTASIGVDVIVLVFQAQENVAERLVVQCYRSGLLAHDTLSTQDAALKELGQRYLRDGDPALFERLQVQDTHEELLINGVTRSTLVGKIVATSKAGAFNTFGRELLATFAGVIRQRIVDFNKEWRSLAASFRASDCARLLAAEDYATRYLSPREAPVAIVFVDISGFTRLSEQELKTPERVANFVELWSKHAVDIVWAEGGVFDKMVGDCIIALFGPPFFDERPNFYADAALRAASAIRTMTETLPTVHALEELRDVAVTVSTGVHYAPLFVGTFGPNQNYTGFSSGMNNTARLQGLAAPGEILAMSTIVEIASPEFQFGAAHEGRVKNVAQPLVYAKLERTGERK